jgi:hypothetical protein
MVGVILPCRKKKEEEERGKRGKESSQGALATRKPKELNVRLANSRFEERK